MSANTAVPPAAPSVELATSSRLSPVRPMPLHEVQRAMGEYQQGLQAILVDTDWQAFTTNSGEDRRFVKRSGWRKIATWFGLDLLIDPDKVVVDRDATGKPLRARVIARVVAPNGRMAEDVGACSGDERYFTKLEHDLVSTAATRALNRATANLVGMGEVSAEEIASEVEPMLPAWAQGADPALMDDFVKALAEFVGMDTATSLIEGTIRAYGYVPVAVAKALLNVHRIIENPPPKPERDEPWNEPQTPTQET